MKPPSNEKRERRHRRRCLQREEFVDFWTMKFGDWLLIGGKHSSEASTRVYHEWVREQLARNRPLDEFVRELLLAQGELTRNGPANFFTLASDPRDLGRARQQHVPWHADRLRALPRASRRIAGRRTTTTPSPPTSRVSLRQGGCRDAERAWRSRASQNAAAGCSASARQRHGLTKW